MTDQTSRIVTRRLPVWAPKAPAEKDQLDKHHRWRDVAFCTCCGHHGSFEATDLIEHDALCIVRIEEEGVRHHGEILVSDSRDRIQQRVLEALFKRAGALMGLDNKAAHKALAALYEWAPERWLTKTVSAKSEQATDDVRAPFFSEAYLYNLVGKEDARTILALVRAVATAVGYKPGMGQ